MRVRECSPSTEISSPPPDVTPPPVSTPKSSSEHTDIPDSPKTHTNFKESSFPLDATSSSDSTLKPCLDHPDIPDSFNMNLVSQEPKTNEWGSILKTSPNLLANLDWERTYWHPLNSAKTMQVFGILKTDEAKSVAQFWVIGSILYANLVQTSYPTWSVKILLNDIDQQLLIDKLQAHCMLGKSWSGESIADYLQVSSNKERVNTRIGILKYEDIRDKMRRLC